MIASPIMDYQSKPSSYFEGCRADYVAELDNNPKAEILEIGCAGGSTGALALEKGKCNRYVGVELNPDIAKQASARLTDVIVGNVETIELPFSPSTFDAIIVSEVLEHLIDPWSVVERLALLVKPSGIIFASSPNISHYSVILRLLQGQWKLEDRGVMDRTHLRWFTPTLYSQVFEQAGFEVEEIRPVTPFSSRTRFINWITSDRTRHLFMRQISIKARRKNTN